MLHGHPGIEVLLVVAVGRVELCNALALHLRSPLHLIKGAGLCIQDEKRRIRHNPTRSPAASFASIRSFLGSIPFESSSSNASSPIVPSRKCATTEFSIRTPVWALSYPLRGMVSNFFSLPPNLASFFLLSRSISASRPSFTKEVFSPIPVNLVAFFIKSSSI